MIRYFISDLHLSDKRPDLLRAFVLMMQEISTKHQNDDVQLYLLGDFYEAWIGDDYHPEWNQPIEAALRQVSEQGIDLFFIHGNRDFLIGDDWCERVGATLLSEQTLIHHETHPILLTHGDEYCQGDVEYQKFRTMVRTPQWQAQVLAMPLEKRLALAEQLRNDSKSMSADKSLEIMDVTEKSVSDSLTHHKTDILIHGHTHRPEFHFEAQYTRCVLGDWDTFIWLATLKGQHLTQAHATVDVFLETGLDALATTHTLLISQS